MRARPGRIRRKQMEALRDHLCQIGPPAPRRIEAVERPISFNDEMVRALLTGRKNQTRRLAGNEKCCPFGEPGDLLWVRERFAKAEDGRYVYAADSAQHHVRCRPAFHMPRAAARLLLRITSVRRESLQSIRPDDARHEGFDPAQSGPSPRKWFAVLWDRIFTDTGTRWDDDPAVWVIRFERVEATARPARPRRRARA